MQPCMTKLQQRKANLHGPTENWNNNELMLHKQLNNKKT